MTTPNPASIAAVIHRLRRAESMASWNSSPRTTMGTEPMITNQPIRASGSSFGTRPASDPAQRAMIRTMSRRK